MGFTPKKFFKFFFPAEKRALLWTRDFLLSNGGEIGQ